MAHAKKKLPEDELSKILAENGVDRSALAPGFEKFLSVISADSVQIMFSKTRPRLRCMDGTDLSAQAGASLYSIPRENTGPYEAVEVGYPSVIIPEIMRWVEDSSTPTSTVYSSVPVALLSIVIASRGGRDPKQNWRVSCMAIGRGGVLAKRAKIGPLRRVSPGDMTASMQALDLWMQAAVLGSPCEEMAARFELGDADKVALDFAGCMEALVKMGPKRGRSLKGKPWAQNWERHEVCQAWSLLTGPKAEAVLIGHGARAAPRAKRRAL